MTLNYLKKTPINLFILWCCLQIVSPELIKNGIKTKLKNQHQQQKTLDPIYSNIEHESYKTATHHYKNHQQNVELPIYNRPTTENQHISENIITDYYTGCPPDYTGSLPYAYDCRRFLNCWHGKGHVQSCAVGTVFNPETLECDRPHKVQCGVALSTDRKRSAKLLDVTTDNVEILCRGGEQGLRPHPRDCSKFINCANGNVHVQQCGPGTAFSAAMQVCVHKDEANCGSRSFVETTAYQTDSAYEQFQTQQQQHHISHTTDILCPSDVTGLFPYPFDYTKFINCKSGNTAIQNCMPGFAFNIFKGLCEPLENMQQWEHVLYIVSQVSYEFWGFEYGYRGFDLSECYQFYFFPLAQTLITCPPGIEGLHLYPFDAEKYIQCSQGKMTIMHCPETKVFSIGRRSCLPQSQVTKEDRVRLAWEIQQTAAYRVDDERAFSLQNMIYCPIGSNGVFPHPFDCSKYLKCVNGRLVSESCNSGSAFSLSRRMCDSKDVVNSQDRIPSIPVMQNLDINYDYTYLHSLNDGLVHLVCPPGMEGYFIHPFDCTKYLECRRGETIVQTCPNGSVFSISRQKCVARDQVEAYDRVEYKETVKNEFTPESNQRHNTGITCNSGSFGIYPHSADHRKFIRCANGLLTVENCPYNQVFSVERGFCQPDAGSTTSNTHGSFNRNHQATAVQSNYNSFPASTSTTFAQRNYESTPIQSNYDSVHSSASTTNTRTSFSRNHESGPVQSNFNSIHSPTSTTNTRTTFSRNHKSIPVQSNYDSIPATSTTNVYYSQPHSTLQSSRTTHMFNATNYNRNFQSSNTDVLPQARREIDQNIATNVQYESPRPAGSHSLSSTVIGSQNNIQNGAGITCPPGADGHFPHPYDCTKFVMCSNGQVHVQNCGPGTAWNAAMETCDHAGNMGCPNAGNEFTCPPDINGPYQHPYDWHKFLNCDHGKATVMDCGPGTVFSISMRVCEAEQKVPNTDRCTGGTLLTDYNYNNNRDGKSFTSSQPFDAVPLAPMPSYTPQGTTQTREHISNNRWSDMNRSRPSMPVNDHTGTWSHHTTNTVQHTTIPDTTSTWTGTAVHVDHQAPVHTVIHEEGSFQPNRNFNAIQTPLAPFPKKPPTLITNNFKGVDENTQKYPINSYRYNHSREISYTAPGNTWTPIKPPPSTYNTPLYKTSYTGEDVGQRPLPETGFHTLRNFAEQDQLPSESRHVTVTIDETNLYGGLRPPLPTKPTKSFSQPHDQIPQPSQSTTAKISPAYPAYPTLSNATIQTFPRQPHYSTSYSGVTHSRNTTWNNNSVGRKIPQHALIKPKQIARNEQSSENISTPPSTPYHVHNDYKSIKYETSEREDPETAIEPDDLPISDALKLLLRPYASSSDVNATDDIMEKAQSHIMNLAKQMDKETTTTTTTTTIKPIIITKTKPIHHEKDAELILAGEQPNLVTGLPKSENKTKIQDDLKTVNSSTSNRLQTDSSPKQYHNHMGHKPLHHHSHGHHHHHHDSKFKHNQEFHKRHPHLPNPFASEEPVPENSDSDIPVNPEMVATTPREFNIDLRSNGFTKDVCPFDCGQGKCIPEHEVCNGVDNCGNRLDELYCENLGYEVRLTGGESSNVGRVEIKILDKWGYVCDDKFGLRDADVLCRELGFKLGAMEVRGNSYYPPADLNPTFMMDEVDCKGNETSLKECNFKGWGVHNCGPDEVVAVVCKVSKLKCPDDYWLCNISKECIPTAFVCDVTPDCADGSDEDPKICNAPIEYRLEGGRRKAEGRLEVYYRGEWGTVCDDDFTIKEAQVVCNSLGYYGQPEIVKNIYGPGSGPIWLNQVSCFGNETALDKCNHWNWGENNCNHTEDVSLKCTAGTKLERVPHIETAFDSSSEYERDEKQHSSELDDTDFYDLGMYQNLWQRSSKAVKVEKRCGHFNMNLMDEYEHPEERVINGTVAKRGRHPWQATIRVRGRGGISNHWCGAVLISKRLLLTAAHCLYGYPKGSYYARLGDHYAYIAESSEVDSFIDNWYIHEKFRDEKPMNNDIALVLLKNKVRFNDYVQPVCLPNKDAKLETNRLCTISGWGSIKSGESTPSNILRAAQVPILSDEVCQRKHVYGNKMTENMFCAGSLDESADACDGDSGGPLVCSDDDGETLYGIISWGQHCGYANRPGVYVRVEKYIEWIHEKINLMIQQGKL